MLWIHLVLHGHSLYRLPAVASAPAMATGARLFQPPSPPSPLRPPPLPPSSPAISASVASITGQLRVCGAPVARPAARKTSRDAGQGRRCETSLARRDGRGSTHSKFFTVCCTPTIECTICHAKIHQLVSSTPPLARSRSLHGCPYLASYLPTIALGRSLAPASPPPLRRALLEAAGERQLDLARVLDDSHRSWL